MLEPSGNVIRTVVHEQESEMLNLRPVMLFYKDSIY